MNTSSIKNFDELPLFVNARLALPRARTYRCASAYRGLLSADRLSVAADRQPTCRTEGAVSALGGATDGRHEEEYYTSRDPIKNYFPLPDEGFAFGLSPGALAVYSCLMYIEDRTT